MWKNPQELTGQLPWHIQQQKAISKKVEDEDTHLRSSSDPYTHIKAESCQVGGAYRNTQRERIGRGWGGEEEEEHEEKEEGEEKEDSEEGEEKKSEEEIT